MCSDVQIFMVTAVTCPVPAGVKKMSSDGLAENGRDPTDRLERWTTLKEIRSTPPTVVTWVVTYFR